jgi:hypothetical protein
MKRQLKMIGIAVVVATVVFGVASHISAITKATTFTIIAPTTDEVEVDVGKKGPSLGDMRIFSGPLLNEDRTTIGRLDGHCIVTSSPGPTAQRRWQCFITATFQDAEPGSEIQAAGVGRVEAEDVILSVTGGAGEYQNVRGQALFDYRQQGRVVITYELIP